MSTSGADHIPDDASIEIKLKTLDSQTYTLRVDKQMPVPALKEQIASVTGVVSEQQRLICRGKVLKDDQLLSAYHVEDGHTLHMVVRQPIPLPSEGLPNDSGSDPASSTSRTHHMTPSVIIETFSLPSQGDGTPPEISRILSAVLGSMGIQGLGGAATEIDNREQRPERTIGGSSMLDSVQIQSDQTGSRIPSGFSLGSLQPPVIPDSLTTLTQYLTNIQREFSATVRDGVSNGQAQPSDERNSRQGLPTPENLAEVMVSTREVLTVQVAEALHQLARQLENQANVTDRTARFNTQSSALRIGALVHNMGSFFLELGRTIMTARIGQNPAEAMVNAGPAVFISPTGPNPIMVQPLSFQVGSSLGAIPVGPMQLGSGMVNGLGTGYIPRRIDIQIRRGSQTATANPSREEQSNTQIPSGPRNDPTGSHPANQGPSRASDGSGSGGESGVRVVPLRTMVEAVPGSLSRLSSDASGNPVGIYVPVLGRFLPAASGQAGGEQQASESARDSARDASSRTLNSRQQDSTTSTRSISLNIFSSGGTQSNSEANGQIPNTVRQFLQNLFPGGEIHMEEETTEGVTAASSLTDQGRPSNVVPEPRPEAQQPRASEEGVFLSNILRQIMPLLPGQAGSEPASASQNAMAQDSSTQGEGSGSGASGPAENSNGRASRRPDDCESGSSSTKRQKIE